MDGSENGIGRIGGGEHTLLLLAMARKPDCIVFWRCRNRGDIFIAIEKVDYFVSVYQFRPSTTLMCMSQQTNGSNCFPQWEKSPPTRRFELFSTCLVPSFVCVLVLFSRLSSRLWLIGQLKASAPCLFGHRNHLCPHA